MIFIRENRTMILEKTGIWKNYEKKVGNMHQECLDDYAGKRHLINASIDNIIEQEKCIIIRNLDNHMFLCNMPEQLSNDQLYQLELLSTLSLDDVTYMEVQIHNRENEQFVLIDSVAEQFSNEVIQSYYQKKQDYKIGK